MYATVVNGESVDEAKHADEFTPKVIDMVHSFTFGPVKWEDGTSPTGPGIPSGNAGDCFIKYWNMKVADFLNGWYLGPENVNDPNSFRIMNQYTKFKLIELEATLRAKTVVNQPELLGTVPPNQVNRDLNYVFYVDSLGMFSNTPYTSADPHPPGGVGQFTWDLNDPITNPSPENNLPYITDELFNCPGHVVYGPEVTLKLGSKQVVNQIFTIHQLLEIFYPGGGSSWANANVAILISNTSSAQPRDTVTITGNANPVPSPTTMNIIVGVTDPADTIVGTMWNHYRQTYFTMTCRSKWECRGARAFNWYPGGRLPMSSLYTTEEAEEYKNNNIKTLSKYPKKIAKDRTQDLTQLRSTNKLNDLCEAHEEHRVWSASKKRQVLLAPVPGLNICQSRVAKLAERLANNIILSEESIKKELEK